MDLRVLLGDSNAPAVAVTGLASDSRRVRPGDLFIAYRGSRHDGHCFAADAVAGGARAVISQRPVDVGVVNVVDERIARRLGELGRRFHGAPSRELDVVGVTGTNGKTTVAYHIARILADAGYIGTPGVGPAADFAPLGADHRRSRHPADRTARARRSGRSSSGPGGQLPCP